LPIDLSPTNRRNQPARRKRRRRKTRKPLKMTTKHLPQSSIQLNSLLTLADKIQNAFEGNQKDHQEIQRESTLSLSKNYFFDFKADL
jgi:hypothetical protein